MPILDMPLEKLKNYGGCSPKPSDFDSFWDGELEKIHSFDGKYEIKPCKEIAVKGYKIESLDFCAPDGSVINARIVRPDDDKTHPVVLRFHGKSGHIGAVSEDLAYASAGFASAALNCRSQSGFSDDRTDRGFFGQGGLVVRGLSKGRDYLYYKDVYLDVVRFVDIVKNLKFCDKTRLFARGGSQGGALTVVCAALCPEIKAAAPEFPFLSDFRRVYEMDLMCNAYQEMKDYVRCFCPWDGPERDAMWNTLGYIDIQNLAPRIKADVRWYLGLMDGICPPSTQFACYNKLACKKEMVVYTNHGHEGNWRTFDDSFAYLLSYAD